MSMPILERILRGGRVINNSYPEMAKEVHDGIKRSVFFDVQVAEDIAAQRAKHFQVDESIGLLRAPFPDMFMEWQTLGLPHGCYLTEPTDLRVKGDAVKTNLIATIILYPELVAANQQRWICLDDSAQFMDWGFIGDDFTDEDIEVTNHLMVTAVTALALMNCRNVMTQPVRINVGRNGTQKRRHRPPEDIQYQTIILPGGGTISDGKGAHRATALHRVRGHFKTFTTDKPLLGQHVGTYWWGWQMRGNSDHGTIVSDYELAEHP
jgi:hypothetical protein